MFDLISIIVPVYNVDKYLDNCIESILKQTYKNFEVILVDDGSLDSSGLICDRYADVDKRIRVFHKKNGGLSDARNYGIIKANGKFVTFVDSDDDVTEDYLEHLVYLLKKYNTDIAISQLRVVTKKNFEIDSIFKDYEINKVEALEKMLNEKEFGVSACAKIFKKQLFDEIKFPVNKLYEDNGTTYKLICCCDKLCYSTKKIYNYYKRKSSITNSTFNTKKLDLIELVDEMAENLKEYPVLENSVRIKQIEARFSILRQVAECKPFNKEIYNNCKKYIKYNKKYIFKKESSKRQKIAYILICLGKDAFRISWKIYSFIKY